MAANIKDKLTPEGKKFLEALGDMKNMEVRIGYQAGEAEHDGVDMCEIAMYNELGTVHIPSRPFMRNAVDNHVDETVEHLKQWIDKVIHGKMLASELMMNMGMLVKGLIQEEIAKGDFEPNAPETIRRKGSDTPLIDTGAMRESVNYRIVEKGSCDD